MEQVMGLGYGRMVIETTLFRWSVCFFFTMLSLASSRGVTGKPFRPVVRFVSTAIIMSIIAYHVSHALNPTSQTLNNVIFISFVAGAIGDLFVMVINNHQTQKWILINILDRLLSTFVKGASNLKLKLPDDFDGKEGEKDELRKSEKESNNLDLQKTTEDEKKEGTGVSTRSRKR